MKGQTPFQTVGPFFDVLLRSRGPQGNVAGDRSGVRITIEGTLFDGAGNAIPDGLVETWQPDSAWYGWCHTDDRGRFAFVTTKPGSVAGPGSHPQAPHILFSVMARGVLTRYVTRLYFDDEAANNRDDILALVPAERRPTLIARTAGPRSYHFDIRIQGTGETVFFDV